MVCIEMKVMQRWLEGTESGNKQVAEERSCESAFISLNFMWWTQAQPLQL